MKQQQQQQQQQQQKIRPTILYNDRTIKYILNIKQTVMVHVQWWLFALL